MLHDPRVRRQASIAAQRSTTARAASSSCLRPPSPEEARPLLDHGDRRHLHQRPRRGREGSRRGHPRRRPPSAQETRTQPTGEPRTSILGSPVSYVCCRQNWSPRSPGTRGLPRVSRRDPQAVFTAVYRCHRCSDDRHLTCRSANTSGDRAAPCPWYVPGRHASLTQEALRPHSRNLMKVTEKQKPQVTASENPGASTEPPSGFEPETYALRVRCSGHLS